MCPAKHVNLNSEFELIFIIKLVLHAIRRYGNLRVTHPTIQKMHVKFSTLISSNDVLSIIFSHYLEILKRKNVYGTFAINFFFSYLFLMKASIAESFVGLLKEM
jgi:hypothetical protein